MRQQIELDAKGKVKNMVESKKPDRQNLALTKAMFLLVAFSAHIWRDIAVFFVLIQWRSIQILCA